MRIDILDLGWALTGVLDNTGVGVIDGFSPGHGRRVAYMTARMGVELGLKVTDRIWLCYLSLLHDLGIPEGTRDFHTDGGLMRAHSEFGEENIRPILFAAREEMTDVVRYHHERWDGTGPFGKKSREVPGLAWIISAADHLDLVYDHSKAYYLQKDAVSRFLLSASGTVMDPRSAAVLSRLAEKEQFWLDLSHVGEDRVRKYLMFDISVEAGLVELSGFARIVSRIIDSRSEFTARHSSGLVEKLAELTSHYGFDEERSVRLGVAGHFHDIGKLVIPKSILEKPGPLDREEFEEMKSHVYHTRVCLEKIRGLGEIVGWASNHHEKLDGKGYPEKIVPASREERMIACLDIFQALSEDRPYRKAMSREEMRTVMDGMVARGEIDEGITADCFRML